jgi:hypothetical protein
MGGYPPGPAAGRVAAEVPMIVVVPAHPAGRGCPACGAR